MHLAPTTFVLYIYQTKDEQSQLLIGVCLWDRLAVSCHSSCDRTAVDCSIASRVIEAPKYDQTTIAVSCLAKFTYMNCKLFVVLLVFNLVQKTIFYDIPTSKACCFPERVYVVLFSNHRRHHASWAICA